MTFSGLQDVLPREDIIFKPTSARVEMHAKQKKKDAWQRRGVSR
jgi:hypothetical protein